MSQWRLSTGVCGWLYEASPDEINSLVDSLQSTLQVLSIRLVANTADRYLIILSDGIHFIQAMLTARFTEPLARGEIPQYAIVSITKLQCHIVNGTRLIVIHDLHVVSIERSKIGSPRPAPTYEISIAPTSERTEVSMEIAPEASSSIGVKPVPAITPIQKPGRPTIPIQGLNHYKVNFTIKARVTYKSDIRSWSNARGEGKRFSVTFMDETGDISATGFTAVVDELYDKFEEGKVYYVSKVRVTPTKEKYSKGPNSYELHFERNTEVEECLDATDVPMIKYNFIPLSSLHDLEKDSTCDVLGIVADVGPLSETVSRASNRTVQKRDLTLVDNSLHSARMTIWGKEAETFIGDDVPVVAFKGVKVSDFGGRSLSMVTTSYMSMSPDIPEAHFLRGWYDNVGIQKSFQSYSTSSLSSGGLSFGMVNRSDMRHISDIVESDLGASEKVEFSTCATVMRILEDKLVYPACPMQGCSKKVTQMGSDEWVCERCQRTFPRPEHRYRITMSLGDWSRQAWFTGFDQVGLAILGKTADELEELKERNEGEYKAFVARASRKTYNFRCLAKQDTYNDQKNLKYEVTKISPLDYYDEAKHLRDLLMQPNMK